MFDKRALRKKFSDSFQQAINQLDKDCVVDRSLLDQSQQRFQSSNVFARKRPLFDHETAAGEYDVVRATHDGALVHGCMMRADLKQPYLATYFAEVPCFNESTSTETVIQTMGIDQVSHLECTHPLDSPAQPCVDRVPRRVRKCATEWVFSLVQLVRSSLQGATNAFCCFGQTGSGKTYTMRGILTAVGQQLFPTNEGNQQQQHQVQDARGQGINGDSSGEAEVAVRCYEVCGRNCHDLLEKRASVKVQDNMGGRVQVGVKQGCQEIGLVTACPDYICNRAASSVKVLNLAALHIGSAGMTCAVPSWSRLA